MPDIMKALNDTYFDAPFEPVASMFERQVQLAPDKPAVMSTALSLTYKELNCRSNSIANSLLELGIAADDTVMLFLERSALVYAANIGILKAGAAFVYAPPSYPEERVRYIFRDASCRYLITSRETDPEKLNAILGKDERPLYIEELLEHNNTADPHAGIKARDLAYCIYTSGSTGRPKGVMIEEDNLFNFLHHNPKNTETVCIAENSSVLLARAALTFDVSIMEEFIPLTSGGTVAFATDTEIMDPLLLKEFILRHKVDGICITPSFLNTLVSIPAMKEALKNIRVYDMGAEAFPGSLFTKVRLCSPNAIILNGYGPTEATISCTVKILENGDNVSIGRPNANVCCYIVDKDNNECAAGEVGELLIAGRGVGRGYKNLPEKTAEAFIEFKGMRSYKTGDLARITPDGEIEFHGRRDSQVKLRGLRIELGEIEESMSGFDGIDSCAAAVIDSRMLCLYYVPSRPISKDDISSYASSILPRYMVPDLFIELKEMPMTANMKIDRKALPMPDVRAAEHETPTTDMQKRLLEMISSLMPGRDIGIETDLNAIGTTSLEYMAILAAIGDEYAVSVNFSDVVNVASIKELEGIIKSRPRLKPKEKLDRYPASIAQYVYYEEWTAFNSDAQTIPILMEIPPEADIHKFKSAVKNAFLNHTGIFARLDLDSENGELWQLLPKDPEEFFAFGEDLYFKEESFEAFKYMLSMQLISPESYPYFRLHIAKSDKRHFLYMNFAHVISDGDSVELLMEDIARSYDGLALAKEGLTAYELALEQSETADSPLYDETEEYYKEAFKDLEEWPDLSEGGTGADAAYDYVRESLCLGPEEINKLTEAYSVTESTLFAALTALFIYKYSQKKDSAFMMAYNGRSDSRLSHTFGLLATEIPLCFEVKEDESFSGFLSKVKKRIVGSLSKELLSIDWFAGRYPNFLDYLYIYQEEGKDICLNGTKIKPIWLEQVDAPKDDGQSFSMSIEDYFEKKKGNIFTEKKPSEPAQEQAEENEDKDRGSSEKLTIIIHPGKKRKLELFYLTSCFRRDTIEAMHRYYNEMLQRLYDAHGKAMTVGELIF